MNHSIMNRRLVPLVFVVAFLIALPSLLGNDFYINLASQILIYALLALSLNLLVGFGGMVSLGHAAYLGIASYSCAWFINRVGAGQFEAAVAALLMTSVIAAGFGVLALRATGLGFLMITLALGQIAWGVAYRWVDLTGGDNGIRLDARPMPFGIDISTPERFYYFAVIVFAAALFCMWRMARSPFGASLRGTRDQPRRMRMLGFNVWLIRWITFVMSGFWGALAGLLYLYYHKFVSPQALALQQSAEVLLMTILGGASTLTGPIVGAVIITLVKNVASSYIDRWNSLLGGIFVVAVVFMPLGIVPGCKRLWESLRAKPKQVPSQETSRLAP